MHNMEIRIHTQSGSVETFFQDNPALIAPIFKGIQSTKVFASNVITIAGDYSLTTFVASLAPRKVSELDRALAIALDLV